MNKKHLQKNVSPLRNLPFLGELVTLKFVNVKPWLPSDVTSLKDPLLSVSLFCHLASIILCALILSETLALYKSFTYLITYLQTDSTLCPALV